MNEWLQRPTLFNSDGSPYMQREDTYAERLDRLR
jgi:hypothetical protein